MGQWTDARCVCIRYASRFISDEIRLRKAYPFSSKCAKGVPIKDNVNTLNGFLMIYGVDHNQQAGGGDSIFHTNFH